jgi:lipopolysaccharide export system permease protein
MDGEIHKVPADGDVKKYQRLRFTNHTIILRDENAALNIPLREARSEREMNITMLQREIDRLKVSLEQRRTRFATQLDSLGFADYESFTLKALPPPTGFPGFIRNAGYAILGLFGARPDRTPSSLSEEDRQRVLLGRLDVLALEKRINAYKVEIHKKFSIPFACIVFVLLGAPMGMKARKGGMATSAISVAFFVVYYLFLIGGEQLADRNVVSPAMAMWAPNVVLGIPGVWLTWKALTGRDGRG